LDYIIYLIYRFFEFLFHLLPKFVLKHILHAIASLGYLFAKKHNRIANANLDLAFGETKTEEEKVKIIKSSFVNMVYNIYEFIMIQRETLKELECKALIENEDIIFKLIEEKKKIIIVTGHYGCWEFLIPFVAAKYKPMTVIIRPMNNKHINNVYEKARDRYNLSICEKKGAAKCIIKAFRSDRMVAMTIDQSINRKLGIDVNFFGHKATQTDSPVRLATKMDAVILPIFTSREGFEKYKVIFKEPIEVKQNMNENEIQSMSQKLSDLLEDQIRKKPDDWFWQHRRWKVYYPEIYTK